MARVIESDVCIIGAGITAAMVAERLTEDTDARIAIVEAGESSVPLGDRNRRRARYLAYGENPWPNDHINDQFAHGIMSRSMVVGGQASPLGRGDASLLSGGLPAPLPVRREHRLASRLRRPRSVLPGS